MPIMHRNETGRADACGVAASLTLCPLSLPSVLSSLNFCRPPDDSSRALSADCNLTCMHTLQHVIVARNSGCAAHGSTGRPSSAFFQSHAFSRPAPLQRSHLTTPRAEQQSQRASGAVKTPPTLLYACRERRPRPRGSPRRRSWRQESHAERRALFVSEILAGAPLQETEHDPTATHREDLG